MKNSVPPQFEDEIRSFWIVSFLKPDICRHHNGIWHHVHCYPAPGNGTGRLYQNLFDEIPGFNFLIIRMQNRKLNILPVPPSSAGLIP
jgi:hypothetical protein